LQEHGPWWQRGAAKEKKQNEHQTAALKRYEEEQKRKKDDNRWQRFVEIAQEWKEAELARQFIVALKNTEMRLEDQFGGVSLRIGSLGLKITSSAEIQFLSAQTQFSAP
jgi:hypothetical protein